MYDIMHLPNVIEIGRCGENLFRTIEIDMRPWLQVLPDGVASIIHVRPGETESDAYITGATMTDGILRWSPTNADLGTVEGYGQMEVFLEETADSDTKRGKSVIVQSFVRGAIASGEATPPEPQESWLEQMTELKTETVTAASEAAGSADDAADSAEDSEAWAVGQRNGTDVGSDDPTYHNNSKYYSEDAADSATDAGSAKTAAETAQGKAEAAQTAAETAQGKAEAAALHYPYVDGTTGDWFVWNVSSAAYVDTGVHAKGDTGTVPDIEIGTVTTLAPDQSAYVTRRSGSPDDAPIFDFGIPKGDTGQAGNVYGNTIDMSSTDPTKVSAAINAKAAKVSGATNGNFAGLDSNGDLTDSGHKHSDYLTAHQDISGKADKVSSAANGNFAGLDSNGNLTDSGHKHSDYKTAQTAVSDPTASGTTDEFIATLSQDANGVITPTKKTVQDASQSVHGLMSSTDKTKLDNISQMTQRYATLAVATSDWTLSGGVYTAEFTTAYVTTTSHESLKWDQSYWDYAVTPVSAAKKTGGGGIILTTATVPTGTITGTLTVVDNDDGKIPVIIENTTVPIENGGTNASNLAGARANLGIPDVVDNLTTNDGTKALSAAQGYALNGKMTKKSASGTNLNYVNSVTFTEKAGVVIAQFDGFAALPNGGWTNICTIPSGFVPSGNINIDVVQNTDDQCSGFQVLRFRVNTNGYMQVYNYGGALTHANAHATISYIV